MTWQFEQVKELFEQPFLELMYQAHVVHRQNFKPNEIQLSSLLNVKTGLCPEDCGYCSQSAHHKTDLVTEKMKPLDEVKREAQIAKDLGATRFCIAAAWRTPPKKGLDDIIAMVKTVKDLEMEACVTLGMLTDEHAQQLKEAGVDYYNHNLDSSPEYYKTVVTTRTYQDRLDTLERVRKAGMNVCCGGIIGMGESHDDRIELLRQLANLPEYPLSVPINMLMPVEGTPLGDSKALDPFELIRTVAVARILMPKAKVRLSAGRTLISDEAQAWCFFAGANSIFLREKLLTVANPDVGSDRALFEKLGLMTEENPCCNKESVTS